MSPSLRSDGDLAGPLQAARAALGRVEADAAERIQLLSLKHALDERVATATAALDEARQHTASARRRIGAARRWGASVLVDAVRGRLGTRRREAEDRLATALRQEGESASALGDARERRADVDRRLRDLGDVGERLREAQSAVLLEQRRLDPAVAAALDSVAARLQPVRREQALLTRTVDAARAVASSVGDVRRALVKAERVTAELPWASRTVAANPKQEALTRLDVEITLLRHRLVELRQRVETVPAGPDLVALTRPVELMDRWLGGLVTELVTNRRLAELGDQLSELDRAIAELLAPVRSRLTLLKSRADTLLEEERVALEERRWPGGPDTIGQDAQRALLPD